MNNQPAGYLVCITRTRLDGERIVDRVCGVARSKPQSWHLAFQDAVDWGLATYISEPMHDESLVCVPIMSNHLYHAIKDELIGEGITFLALQQE
jgi:hypothetical protein